MSDKPSSNYAVKRRGGVEANHQAHDPKRPIPWCALCQRDYITEEEDEGEES